MQVSTTIKELNKRKSVFQISECCARACTHTYHAGHEANDEQDGDILGAITVGIVQGVYIRALEPVLYAHTHVQCSSAHTHTHTHTHRLMLSMCACARLIAGKCTSLPPSLPLPFSLSLSLSLSPAGEIVWTLQHTSSYVAHIGGMLPSSLSGSHKVAASSFTWLA